MLKEALRTALDKEELNLLSSSFDVVGDIAIVKIPSELEKKKSVIANEILSRMKNVRTVLRQSSAVQGEFRTRELEFVGGIEQYETIHKENGCFFRVNVREAYFSPRLSTERERIANLVMNGERIFNMFAGIGTFSIIIAKTKVCTADTIDKNEKAIEFCFDSIKLNKKLKGSVVPVLSDAKDYATSHEKIFDRVIMALPERSKEFLPAAILAAKPDARIHYYVHVSEENYIDKNWIRRELESSNLTRNYELVNWKRVREVGPRFIQAVADIKLD